MRRTRRALRELGRRAAHFEWIPLKERIGTVFLWVHSAWDQQKMQLAGDHVTEWFAGNQQLKLDKWKRIEPDSASLDYLAEPDRVRQERVAPRPA